MVDRIEATLPRARAAPVGGGGRRRRALHRLRRASARQASRPRFTPCVEVGWRLAHAAWGHGYATEAARAAIADGFARLGPGRDRVVHEPRRTCARSAVMRRLGMTHDPADDFDHPRIAVGSPLRRPRALPRCAGAERSRRPLAPARATRSARLTRSRRHPRRRHPRRSRPENPLPPEPPGVATSVVAARDEKPARRCRRRPARTGTAAARRTRSAGARPGRRRPSPTAPCSRGRRRRAGTR